MYVITVVYVPAACALPGESRYFIRPVAVAAVEEDITACAVSPADKSAVCRKSVPLEYAALQSWSMRRTFLSARTGRPRSGGGRYIRYQRALFRKVIRPKSAPSWSWSQERNRKERNRKAPVASRGFLFLEHLASLTISTLTTYSLTTFAPDTPTRLAGIGDPLKISQGC